jgi:SAM-dependent methyltransferase
MTALCLPDGYVENPTPVAYAPSDVGPEWQPDVLPFAADLARFAGASTIVDLGCGAARKLIPLASEFDVIGVDLPEIIDALPDVPGATWIAHDLEAKALPKAVVVDGSVVVCSDVIEHVPDVARLRTRFRQVLRGGAGCVVISTPDRDCYYEPDHLGPPRNPTHVREWSLDELADLLTSWGFTIEHAGHTRSNDASPNEWTSLVVIS